MRKSIVQVTLPVCGAILLAGSWLAYGGSLTPPSGAIAATGRFGPRIEIESLPFTITTPGSYYLTKNMSSAGGGITIAVSDVSIDLNGFMVGPGPGQGIVHGGATGNITIKNGMVSGWTFGGIDLTGASGCRVENVLASGNVGGLGIHVGNDTIVRNCVVRSNAANNGIDAAFQCVVTGCTASNNGGRGIKVGAGSVVSNCAANSNTGVGIEADNSLVLGNAATGNNGGGVQAALPGGSTNINNHGF